MSGGVRTRSARGAIGVALLVAFVLAALFGRSFDAARARGAAVAALSASARVTELSIGTSAVRAVKATKAHARAVAEHVGTHAIGPSLPPSPAWSIAAPQLGSALLHVLAPSRHDGHRVVREHRSRAPPQSS